MVPAGFARIAPSRGFLAVLREQGIDPAAVMAVAGVDPGLFDQPEGVIRYRDLGALMAAGATASDCPHFGLLVGQRCPATELGLIGVLAREALNVGDALGDFVALMHVFDRAATVAISVEADVATFSYVIIESDFPGSTHICDGSIAIACNFVRALCGESWAPAEVRLQRRKPDDASPYRRHFRARIGFDANETALVFPASVLDRGIQGADMETYQRLSRIAQDACAGRIALAELVRRRLRAGLPRQWMDEASIARQLGLGRSTLRRRLAAEGASFRQIAAGVRFEMAKHLIRETGLSLSEVALAVGYAELPVFTRAFRAWSGISPRVWRDRNIDQCAPDC
jgi:AraC-like DNA-binding protein